MLRYSEAKADFDRSKTESDLDRWKGSKLMAAVKRNTFDLARERRKRIADARASEKES